jgi:hypothetical protein
MKILAFLKDWFVQYIKHKDLFTKSIVEIKDVGDREVQITHKDRGIKAFILPDLVECEKAISALDKKSPITLVTINSSQNFDTLIKLWKVLKEYEKLNIFFVNTFSGMDKRWVIYPATHDRIADSSSLKLGLTSMFQMVEPISVEEYEKRI